MSPLDPELGARLHALVHSDRTVLFMKGSPSAPRCGFSARVVELIDGHLAGDYTHVDVLAHPEVRDGIKQFANWPTFPQLWVDGQLVGGADIVEQLHDEGGLANLLGPPRPTPSPAITLTPAARQRILGALSGVEPALRLQISPSFEYRFESPDPRTSQDVAVDLDGLTLLLDRSSAGRADGMTIDFEPGEQGGMVIHNPNEPRRVQSISVQDYARLQRADQLTTHRLIDVRTPAERQIASIHGSELLDQELLDQLLDLPQDTPLVFVCHHGVRSLQAAQHFLERGFQEVYNLEGGIDAWSLHVDQAVPRY